MSYFLKITVENGTATISDEYVAPPDGTYIISGHLDAAWENFSAIRTDTKGTQMGQVSMSVAKPATGQA